MKHLFARTRFNGTRVGHGGNDPGLSALMLADLSGEIGIIVFSNTSLGGSDQRRFVDIQNAVWALAEELRKGGDGHRGRRSHEESARRAGEGLVGNPPVHSHGNTPPPPLGSGFAWYGLSAVACGPRECRCAIDRRPGTGGTRINRLALLLTTTLAFGAASVRAAEQVDLNTIPSNLLQRMDVESGGPARDDPVALARARRELERLRDPQGRVAWLADNVQRERQSWEFLAPRIGLSPEELEQFLVAKAEGELQWTKRSMECQVDLACNWGEQPEGRRDSDAELLRLLGKDRHARYRKYIGAMTERSYVREMQRRLPPDDPLADAQAEQFALALAEERERLIAEALRQGETVSGPAYFNTLQLYGVAKEGSPDEFTKRRESAAEYAGRLFGRASALLSRSQLADFKQMLDRNLAVYDESMREREVMAAARISNSGTPTTTNQKKPETLALARYRLERLREPGNYKAEAARLTAQIRYDWYQRAVVAEVSSRIYDQLVDALGVAELQHQELLLECDADPVCDRYALRASHNAALDEQAASIAGADKFAIMQVYKEAYDERSFVDDLRSQLPPDHALTDPAAWKLALALATERQRFVRSAERDGLELHVFTPLLATSRPGTTDGNAQRLATAAGYARRLHDVAASNLDGEQIRQFDALHQQSLARLKAALQESEWLQSVREAAASQGQNHEAVERR